MAAREDIDTPAAPSTTMDVHYLTVSQRVPQWLLDSSPQRRQALRATVPRALPWLSDAGYNLPWVTMALREEGQRQHLLATAVQGCLQALLSAEVFAEPLLREAIKTRFGLDLDVRRTFLFNAARARVDESLVTGGDPVVKAFQVVKAATQSLLAAALQNFEAFEAAADGMRDGRRPSMIFASDSGQPLAPGETINLLPEHFAALCRELDLGGRYQRQIEAVFRPAPGAGGTVSAATAERQGYFKDFEQSTFRLNLHLAYLQSWVAEDLYHALLDVANNGKASGDLKRSALKLWDVELNGIVLFFRQTNAEGAPQRLLVYMPDEPRQPFEEFASLGALNRSLVERLRDPQWRTYFLRFVPARERDPLMRRVQRTLSPRVWNPGGWYEDKADPNAVLHLNRRMISGPLFDHLLQRKIAVLKDDGLFHAVPTAVEDHKSAQAKVSYFLGVAFDVLNVAAFVVPGVGEVMLVVNAAMLGYEVYEGFDSLSQGEREEAWTYFMDVGENLVLMAAMGAAGSAAHRFTGNLPLAVRSMRPVTLADGSVRLWKPDLTPFAYDIRLPADLTPGENGLYAWQNREWLALDGRYYSVRTLLGHQERYSLEHPKRAWAYEPEVLHNGNGGWLHELDTPQHWHGLELFRRQGHREAGVSAEMALRALRISGISEAHLRHSLVHSQRPPALLTDTLRRLALAEHLGLSGAPTVEAFDAAYQAQMPALSVQSQALKRQFDLPGGLLDEIVRAATDHEFAELSRSGRVPPRLAEEARIYRQQLRLARACEGLYLDVAINPDSACLLLHALEGLPGWPAGLRIGLYEATPGGKLLGRIGGDQKAEIALLWRGQLPTDFCQALFDSLPLAVRDRLALNDAGALREAIRQQPLAPRHTLRAWLGMAPSRPGFRSPMRLADGRIGYPLSGRGHPFFTEDELLDKLRLLEIEELYPEDALQALYRSGLDRAAINGRLDGLLDEMLVLRQCLDRWSLESASEALSETRQRSRERIGQALWDYWRRGLLPELGRPAAQLVLEQVRLEDLPTQLPAFLRERVRDVVLDAVSLRDAEQETPSTDEPRWQAFVGLFPNLATLDIRSGDWQAGLPQMIARVCPWLTALGLRDQARPLGFPELRALATMPRLRRLSLRGSRLGELPVSVLNGMVLDYLGLDLLGLEQWPHWLDNAALDRIGELSLVGNQLREVPMTVLADWERVARPLRIALQGNNFDYQALLDMALAQRFHGRFIFDVELSANMTDTLYQRVLERAQLQAALQAWADPMQVPAPLAPGHVVYRQRISGVLLDYWREELRNGQNAALVLEDLALDDFPGNLPPFFASRVRRLDLNRFSGSSPGLERLLGQFQHLRQLTLAASRPALSSVPAWLTAFPLLQQLALVNMDMLIDQAAMNVFAGMPGLSQLRLEGNRLGGINDMSPFRQRYLGVLGLARMQISTWPAWLDQLLPNGVGLLSLDDNQLVELPEPLLANPRMETGAVEISLRNNPLSRDTLIRAHLSQCPGRPYTFTMDLPDDIAAMERPVSPTDVVSPETPEVPQTPVELTPSSWQALRGRLVQLQLDDSFAGSLLQALHRSGLQRGAIATRVENLFVERETLRGYLARWAGEVEGQVLTETRQRNRERLGNALWEHWRRTLLPEFERPPVPLVLWQIPLAELPRALPDFYRLRVRGVLLDDAVLNEDDAAGQMIGERDLLGFARQFPNLVSLDIRGGRWTTGLAQLVARAWPRLDALGLRELDGMLGVQDLRALASLPRLRRLELRGSRLRDVPADTLHGMNLDYLGLDWLDLQEWPRWLDNATLLGIRQLSMVGNQLSELPARVLSDISPVNRPLFISLQGNQLRHQALLDILLAERFHGRFHFDLDMSPALADVLRLRVQERVQLQEALRHWVDPALTPALAEPEQVARRQRIARELLTYWREEVRGGATAVLCLDDFDLEEFPGNLPSFFMARVQRLDISRFNAAPASLERFVRQFPQLRELSLIRGLSPLTEVPPFLERFSQLRELALVHMGLTVDQAAMESFARIPELSSLQLDGNRFGEITDVSIFETRFFGFFSLAQMELAAVPDWLCEMLPNGIELLCLDDNQISELPEFILQNRRTDSGAVEISLRDNPLTRDTLIRAHTSQHYDRPFSFSLDLPPDIAAMEHEVHTSDSEDGESLPDDPMTDEDPLSTWETGILADDLRNQLIWNGLAARGDAESLLGLIALLRYSADYRSIGTRAELIGRVWTVLTAAAKDTELRQTLNGMAQEPVQQLHSHETCPDGIRLEFNQMEFQVHTRQALSEITDEHRGPALFRLMRGIFRSQTLDRIAREQSNGRDEAEVRLAYRLRWAETLQLPAPPRGMLYRGAANLGPGELDRAMTQLQLEESGQELQRFAAQCDFWVAYLREAFAERFRLLRENYEAAVLNATEAYPDETLEQSSARIRALESKFKQDEQDLLEHLTREYAMSAQ